MRSRQFLRCVAATLVACALLSTACGTSTTEPTSGLASDQSPLPAIIDQAQAVDANPVGDDDAATDPVTAPRETTGGALTLPSIEVVDLLSGAAIDLAEYSPPGPTLVWFWAPH